MRIRLIPRTNALHPNPQNALFGAKRIVGRKMNDPDIVHDMKHWPFKVSEKQHAWSCATSVALSTSTYLHLPSNAVTEIVPLMILQPLISLSMRRLRWTIHFGRRLIVPIHTLAKARLYSCHLPPRPILWTHL